MSYSEYEARLVRDLDEAREKLQAWEVRMKAITGEDSPDAAGNVVISLKAERDALKERCQQKNLALAAVLSHCSVFDGSPVSSRMISNWVTGMGTIIRTVIGPAYDVPKGDAR